MLYLPFLILLVNGVPAKDEFANVYFDSKETCETAIHAFEAKTPYDGPKGSTRLMGCVGIDPDTATAPTASPKATEPPQGAAHRPPGSKGPLTDISYEDHL